jgi:hypothetical protein
MINDRAGVAAFSACSAIMQRACRAATTNWRAPSKTIFPPEMTIARKSTVRKRSQKDNHRSLIKGSINYFPKGEKISRFRSLNDYRRVAFVSICFENSEHAK